MFFAICFLACCENNDSSPASGSFESMGTTITVQPLAALGVVQKVFEQTELEMSEWKEDSPLSLINEHAEDRPVEVPQDLFHALQRSLDIAEMTSGAFDPTWASLWKIWKFDDDVI